MVDASPALELQYLGVAVEPSWLSAKYRFTIKRLCTSFSIYLFMRGYSQTEDMVLSEGDKAIIEACVREKRWGAKRIVKEFPGKGWSVSTVKRWVKRVNDNVSTAAPVLETHQP
jgi:hypothetical protein